MSPRVELIHWPHRVVSLPVWDIPLIELRFVLVVVVVSSASIVTSASVAPVLIVALLRGLCCDFLV